MPVIITPFFPAFFNCFLAFSTKTETCFGNFILESDTKAFNTSICKDGRIGTRTSAFAPERDMLLSN